MESEEWEVITEGDRQNCESFIKSRLLSLMCHVENDSFLCHKDKALNIKIPMAVWIGDRIDLRLSGVLVAVRVVLPCGSMGSETRSDCPVKK